MPDMLVDVAGLAHGVCGGERKRRDEHREHRWVSWCIPCARRIDFPHWRHRTGRAWDSFARGACYRRRCRRGDSRPQCHDGRRYHQFLHIQAPFAVRRCEGDPACARCERGQRNRIYGRNHIGALAA